MNIKIKRVFVFGYLLPRNVVVFCLRGYRTLISPLYGDVCRYYPSCSLFGLQAIQQRGLVLGSVLTLRRLGRCHPWASGGVDDVPPVRHQRFRVTSFGFVVMNSDGRP